jgi:glycopeptide antibiotics resistance protein
MAYTAVLLVVLLTSDGGVPSSLLTSAAERARALGMPEQVLLPARFEFICNVLVVVPMAFLGARVWRSPGWAAWTGYGFTASLAVEAIQAIFMPERSATFSDVVANTAGAMIGGAAAVLLRNALESRGST